METAERIKKESSSLNEASKEMQKVLIANKGRAKQPYKQNIKDTIGYIIGVWCLYCGVIGVILLVGELLKY